VPFPVVPQQSLPIILGHQVGRHPNGGFVKILAILLLDTFLDAKNEFVTQES